MLNKRRKLFHSSRVKLSLFKMSASWCCQCTWSDFVGSRLILSNNQFKATLWAQDTCLIVGLLPLIIILITASLSSKTPEPQSFTFHETWSILARSRLMCLIGIWFRMLGGVLGNRCPWNSPRSLALWVWFCKEWNTSITKSQRSRASIPSMRKPASKEFLHIQLVGTNVWLPKMHRSPLDLDFESSKSCKIRILKQS